MTHCLVTSRPRRSNCSLATKAAHAHAAGARLLLLQPRNAGNKPPPLPPLPLDAAADAMVLALEMPVLAVGSASAMLLAADGGVVLPRLLPEGKRAVSMAGYDLIHALASLTSFPACTHSAARFFHLFSSLYTHTLTLTSSLLFPCPPPLLSISPLFSLPVHTLSLTSSLPPSLLSSSPVVPTFLSHPLSSPFLPFLSHLLSSSLLFFPPPPSTTPPAHDPNCMQTAAQRLIDLYRRLLRPMRHTSSSPLPM